MKKILAFLTAVAMLLSFTACKKSANYESAERSFVKKGVGEYSKLFALANGDAKSEGKTLTMKFTPEDYILDLLGQSGTKVNPTVFEITEEVNGKDVYVNYIYKNGSKEIISADLWVTEKNLIMLLPALSDKYISQELEEGLGAALGGSSLASIEPPSDKAVQKVIDKVYDEYFKLYKDAPVEKNVEVEVEGLSVKANKTDIKITAEDAAQLASALLEAVQDSDEIKDFISDYMTASNPYVYEDFDIDDMLEQALEGLEDADDGGDEYIKMSVYVSGSDVVKRDIKFVSDDAPWSVSYAVVTKGKDSASECEVESGDNSVKVTDKNTKKGSSYTGKTKVTTVSNGQKVTVGAEYEDLAFDKENNVTGGKITVTSDALGESLKINLEFEKDSFTGSFTLGSAKVATVELSYEDAKGKSAPKLDDSNSISVDDFSSDEEMMTKLQNIFTSMDDNGVYDIFGFMLIGMGMGGIGSGSLGF